ncbi:MAG: hypothetical protein V1660_00315 [archaeon]
MRPNNNVIALSILFFIFLSAVGNMLIWFYTSEEFPTGLASRADINVCLDIPPQLNVINLTSNSTMTFSHQINATDSGSPRYFYYNASSLPSFSMNSSGFINFTSLEGEIGNHTITVWVTHNICPKVIDWRDFNMQVVLFNLAPYWINLTSTQFSGTENAVFSLNLSSNATDSDNDIITFASNSTTPDFPSFNITPRGFINFTASDMDVCFNVVNVTISDGRGGLNSTPLNITIANINDAPVLSQIPDQQACENVFYYLNTGLYAFDADVSYVPCSNQQLHFYDNSSLFVINENTGEIAFTPTPENEGFYFIRLFVTDNLLADYKDMALTVIEVNDAPVLQSVGSRTLRTNRTLYIDADANDEEDGSDPIADLTFNVTFLSGVKFFDINPLTGVVNSTTNDSLNGTYSVRFCVVDSGIPNPHINASSFCGDGSPKSDCEIVSIVLSSNNFPPVITYYMPQTNMTIYENDTLQFGVIAYDPEGGELTNYWYLNYTLIQYNGFNFSFHPLIGESGRYNISINVSDGELNASVSWVITVLPFVYPPTPPVETGAGGGGGASCKEIWACTDWSLCQNSTPAESKILLESHFERIIRDCVKKKIKAENCGFRMRACKQESECKTLFSKPAEVESCFFTVSPSCSDGIMNCHHGSCEILLDCGGPCAECPTCSDGIKNQGEEWIDCGGPCSPCQVEYPKPPKCGDNKCEISELFNCSADCGFLWFIVSISLVLLLIVILISSREMGVIHERSLRAQRLKRQRYIASLLGLAREAVANKNIKLAKQLYDQIKQSYESLHEEEKKNIYTKIIKVYAEIEKLEESG